MSISGDFGQRLNASIKHGENPSFILNGERCPFLNKDNLCDIILTLGEEHICEICTEHPRFHEWFDGLTETGLGLCCEEACSPIFADEKPLGFIRYDTDEAYENSVNDNRRYDKRLFDALFAAREAAFYIAQNRDFTINERMAVLMSFTCSLQCLIDNNGYDEISALCVNLKNSGVYRDWLDTHTSESDGADFLKGVISLCGELEPIDGSWTDFCAEAGERLSEIIGGEDSFKSAFKPLEYTSEHLLVYFIYRYFLKAVFDEEIISGVTLGVLCVTLTGLYERLLFLKNGAITKADVEQAVKLISKEIEYSEENLDRLADECYGGAITTERVTEFLLGFR